MFHLFYISLTSIKENNNLSQRESKDLETTTDK